MNVSRLAYRARQFWQALLRPEKQVESKALLPYLSPAELILFRRMQPSEQAHAYRVLRQLMDQGETQPDLLSAALLHDVGKILSPLSIIDRVVIVLGKRFFPKASRRWAEGAARGWHRPFVVGACHGEWGADLVKQAGASELTVELVRRHQEPPSAGPQSQVDELLAKLRAVDDEN